MSSEYKIYDQAELYFVTYTTVGWVEVFTGGQTIYYDYDGAGNRIYKDVVNALGTPGEVHNAEYYVRDAGGNILATYKVNKVYKGDILALDDAMLKGDSNAYKAFMTGDMGPLPDFKSALLNEAVTSFPNWVDSQLAAWPPSFYFGNNSTWNTSLLQSTSSWMDSLRDYSNNNSLNFFETILDRAATANDADMQNWLTDIIQASTPGSPEYAALMTHLDIVLTGFASPPYVNAADAFWNSFGIGFTIGNPPASANSFVNAVPPPAPPMVVSAILMAIAAHPSISTTFWGSLINDNTIWQSSAYRPGSWETELTNMVLNYGSQSSLNSFYDNYWLSSGAWLATNLTKSDELGYVYDMHPETIIPGFVNRESHAGLATMIGGISGMTVGNYISYINASPSGVMAYTGPADTMSLAEHHIYGSSRIGMQTYAWGTVKSVWQEHLGVLDSSLAHKLPWYSEAYGDLVDSLATEPFGRGDTSAGYHVSRGVGLRYYELSDHLGNVLATVLDRKTGHLPSGATTYDYWKADIATATDYYPFGMEMPARTYAAPIGLGSKFGYNGQMKVNEIAGLGNHNTALFWEYDTRTGRRWNQDPVVHPWESPYAAFGNSPIWHNDINGDEWKWAYAVFAARHPVAANQIGQYSHGSTNISTDAVRFSTRGEFLQENNTKGEEHMGSQVNADRHTIWQATITSKFGSDIAKEAGDAHEDHPDALDGKAAIQTVKFKSMAEADEAADLSNNIIGRSIGETNKGADMKTIAQKVGKEFHDNGLFTAQKQDEGTYMISKTKISDNQYISLMNAYKDVDKDGFNSKEQQQRKNGSEGAEKKNGNY